jgi:hypothetical protein
MKSQQHRCAAIYEATASSILLALLKLRVTDQQHWDAIQRDERPGTM